MAFLKFWNIWCPDDDTGLGGIVRGPRALPHTLNLRGLVTVAEVVAPSHQQIKENDYVIKAMSRD